MGDVIFAPLYEVLRRRGVRFEFFHQVRNVGIDGELVDKIIVDQQAEVAGGGDYAPLVDVKGVPCWPASPDFSQLRNGAALQASNLDFERPTRRCPDGLRRYCGGKGLRRCGSWNRARCHPGRLSRNHRKPSRVESDGGAGAHHGNPSVPILALGRSCRCGMGDRRKVRIQDPVAGAYIEPVDTWADMTHLARWGVLDRRGPTGRDRLPVRRAARCRGRHRPARDPLELPRPRLCAGLCLLETESAGIWRAARADDGHFDHEWLCGPSRAEGGRTNSFAVRAKQYGTDRSLRSIGQRQHAISTWFRRVRVSQPLVSRRLDRQRCLRRMRRGGGELRRRCGSRTSR